jgi:hypothetical protein
MHIRKFLPLFAFFLFSIFVKAQPGDLGNWFIYFGHARLSPEWGVWAESQYRNYNFAGDLEQFFVRSAITYDFVGTGAQAALGYGFFRTENYIGATDEKRGFNENRIYQQLITNQRFGRLYMTHRYRLEERFLLDDFRIRFRYFLGLNLCLNKPERTTGTVYLSAYNELFINAESPVFDRDRVYGAVGYVLSPHLRAETGLMYQLFENRRRPQWQIVLFHNMDFSKKDDGS